MGPREIFQREGYYGAFVVREVAPWRRKVLTMYRVRR